MNAEFRHVAGGVGEHVHQVGNGSALVSAHVGDAGLQQRLGNGEYALAAELLARAQTQVFHFACKGALGHGLSLGVHILQMHITAQSVRQLTLQNQRSHAFRCKCFASRNLSGDYRWWAILDFEPVTPAM